MGRDAEKVGLTFMKRGHQRDWGVMELSSRYNPSDHFLAKLPQRT